MSQYPRGSEWRRWDLHLHTASSYDYKYKQDDSDKLLCEKLIENNISLAAITDHFIIDKTRFENLRSLAPDIAFLPGVELRTDKGDTNIHVILIFSETIDINNLCEDFNVFKRNKSKCTTEDERVYWDYNDILDFSKEHNGIITIHAGRKDKGIDNRITNALEHNQAVKAEYASTIDVFEMGQERDLDEYNNKVLPVIGRKSMIICSDNHDPRTYASSKKLWIKADPNFKGLKQAVIEPDRIFIGDTPPSLDRIQKNKTKTIDSLDINWVASYTGNQGEWFKDAMIPLNPEMTVIIGNKGSGKTAIAEIIGLLSNSKNEKDFAFLVKKKFRDKNLSKNFDATMTWYDNVHKISKNLDQHIDENADELVHCVPQNSFEKFCNDNSEDGFINEINSVVFSRMKKEDKLNFLTFEELLRNKKGSIELRKKDIGVGIDALNEKIKLLEEKRDFDHKKSLTNTKTTLGRELDEHIKSKPLEVQPPKDLVTEDYSKNISNLKAIQDKIQEAQKELEIAMKHRSNISLIKESYENLEISLKEKLQSIENNLSEYKLDTSKILKYSLDLSPVISLYNEYDKQVSTLQDLLAPTLSVVSEGATLTESKESTLIDKKCALETLIEKFNSENEGKLTNYQKYLTDSKSWEDKNKDLLQKIKDLNTEIEYIGDCKESSLVADIKALKAERLEKVKQLYKCLTDEQAIYDKFKEPIIKFLDEYQVSLGDFKAEINTGIYPQEDFVNTFVDKHISSNVNGPFKGSDGVKKIKDCFFQYDFSTQEELVSFINHIENEFEQEDETKCYHTMFKKNMYDVFVSDFYKLAYLDARYSLQLFGKELSSLSPGERGSLLLVFYLLLDARDIPLVLDQPEDNLDNESVAKILVPFIREAKKRRQIIIVTHNSNLAVVSDAEQVIRVKIDKLNNYKFSFESGSLESEIITDVIDVLEGTINSFNIRKDKYLN